MADYTNEAEVRARAQAIRSTMEALQAEEQMLHARLAPAQLGEAAAPEAAAAALPPPSARAPPPPPAAAAYAPLLPPRPEPEHPHPQDERERMRDEHMRRLTETVAELGAQLARVREQGGGLGSPIRHDASFMSGSNASYGNGSRSRASGKVPTPPLFSSDEADRDKPGYTEHVFEWVRCMRDYVEFNETDEIRQAQLAISYLKGSAEAAARAHMAKRDSTWQSLQAYLLTTMITPAHVARLRRELNSFEAMRGKNSVKGMVEKFQVLERKINSLPEVHKEYCTMHWKTMLEYLKEGLPEGCVATLNQSPPESMEAAHEWNAHSTPTIPHNTPTIPHRRSPSREPKRARAEVSEGGRGRSGGEWRGADGAGANGAGGRRPTRHDRRWGGSRWRTATNRR